MDAIAAASGVSKATVYKHWTNKDALLIEVIQRFSTKLPEVDSGDPRADLIDSIRYFSQARKPEQLSRIWPRIISYAVSNPEFGRVLQEHVFGPRRNLIGDLLRKAASRGSLRPDIDSAFAMDLLIGPIMHRRFVDQENIPPDFAERLVDYFWSGMGPQKPENPGLSGGPTLREPSPRRFGSTSRPAAHR